MTVAALDVPGLKRLWDAVAERLQRNGLRPDGTLRLAGLERDERHSLAGLLGRAVAADRVTIDLAALDRRLYGGDSGRGLVATVERLRGPLIDRQGRRVAHAEAVAAVWAAGRRAVDEVGLGTAPWVEAWFEDVRRAGSLGRVGAERAQWTLASAVRCTAALPVVTGAPPVGRGDLASLVTGDAHGLDDGSLLGAVTLRAAAAIIGRAYPSSAGERRDLWRAVGVLSDEVSTTVLTAGLRSTRRSWLDDRTDARWESHLTRRDLRRLELAPPLAGVVYVCENPRVVEAAIDAGSRAAIVCTMGQPSMVVSALVEQLLVNGGDLRYHGDFDWPGIAIANTILGTGRCRPWRFGAIDYLNALARLAPVIAELPRLGTVAVAATWDAALTNEMSQAGRAIHEELVLADLVADVSICP